MKLLSKAFENGDIIPAKYSCEGENCSPPLEISEVPEDTQSLVLIMDDPDAPGNIFTHWLVWNIPPTTISIAEDSIPPGAVEGTTSFGKPGYGGPCPPRGKHRYFFKLYALDTPFNFSQTAGKADIEDAIGGHIIGEVELMGLYERITGGLDKEIK